MKTTFSKMIALISLAPTMALASMGASSGSGGDIDFNLQETLDCKWTDKNGHDLRILIREGESNISATVSESTLNGDYEPKFSGGLNKERVGTKMIYSRNDYKKLSLILDLTTGHASDPTVYTSTFSFNEVQKGASFENVRCLELSLP